MQDSLTKRTIKFTLVASVLLIVIVNTACQQLSARVMIRAAYELYQKEQYSQACPLLENALQLMPNDLDLKQSLAFCYMAWYRPDDPAQENQALVPKAETIFKEMIVERPNDPRPEDSLISLYLNANKYDEAAGYLQQQKLSKNPNDIETMKQIASLYIKGKRIEEAFKWYEKWASVEPTNPEPWYAVGSYCWRMAYCEQNRCEDPTLALEKRQEYIQRGVIAIEQHALVVDPAHCESLAYINLLYRAMAKWVDYGNVIQAQDDMKKAEDYRQKTLTCLENRKKLKPGQTPSAEPAKK